MFKVRGLILSFICVLCVPGFVSAVKQQQSAGLSRQMKRLHEYERLQRVLEESNPKLCEQFVRLSEKAMTRAKRTTQDKKAMRVFLKTVATDQNVNQQDKKAIAQFLRSGLSTGAHVGIGVGSAAAVIAALAVLAARYGKLSVLPDDFSLGFGPKGGSAGVIGAGDNLTRSLDCVVPVGAAAGADRGLEADGVRALASRGRSSSLTNNILGGKSAMRGRTSSVDNMLPVSPAAGVLSGPRVAAGADEGGPAGAGAGAGLDEGSLAGAGGPLVPSAAPSATVVVRGDIEAGAGAAAGVVGGEGAGRGAGVIGAGVGDESVQDAQKRLLDPSGAFASLAKLERDESGDWKAIDWDAFDEANKEKLII
ncbi:MAG: hypothetical protein WCJ17_01215, partial [bacterium]